MQGYFESPYIEVEGHPDKKVPPGETVRLRAYYYAYAPEQEWWEQPWTVSVLVYESGGPPWPILGQNDTTHLTEGPIHHNCVVPCGAMPNRSIQYLVVLWANLGAYLTFPYDSEGWVQLDARYITVEPEVEAYKGKISRKELEYDGEQETIPAVDVPFESDGLVHIWGRNDTTSNQKMGIEWWVKNPAGTVIEHYYDWETLWTGPGNAQHFIGDRFFLNKEGNWTIQVNLLMNPDQPQIVDSYNGKLCNILPEAVIYDGTITRKELEVDGVQLSIPVNDVPFSSMCRVHIWGRNDSTENQKIGIRWWVRDPDNQVIEAYSDWETLTTAPGSTHHFDGDDFMVDKPSNWNVKVELLMNPSNPIVVDSYEGRLCTVLPEEELFEGKITKKELEYNGARALVPAVGIPLHEKGIVHIWGRNDTQVNQKMGIAWTVKDPAGVVWQNYTDWETLTTGPGSTHEFKGPSKEFTLAGQYTIVVSLLMNPSNPIEVDRYEGDLCDVGIGAEEEFDALIITKYDASVAVGNPCNIEVSFRYRGPTTSRTLYAALWQSTIIDPHDEVAHGQISIEIVGSGSWEEHTEQVVVYATCDEGIYGLYAKLNGVIPTIISPYYESVVTVQGTPEDLFPKFDATYAKA